jgi:hypothetical protein
VATQTLLSNRGISEAPLEPLYLPCEPGDNRFSEEIRTVARHLGEAGIALLPPPPDNEWMRTFPYALWEGKAYRLLTFPEPLAESARWKTDHALETEFNKVSVPSTVKTIGQARYLLVSVIPRPEFVTWITPAQSEAFLAGLADSRLLFQPEGFAEPPSIVRNMMVIGGRLCYCDGDIMEGRWEENAGGEKEKILSRIRERLSRRIRP